MIRNLFYLWKLLTFLYKEAMYFSLHFVKKIIKIKKCIIFFYFFHCKYFFKIYWRIILCFPTFLLFHYEFVLISLSDLLYQLLIAHISHGMACVITICLKQINEKEQNIIYLTWNKRKFFFYSAQDKRDLLQRNTDSSSFVIVLLNSFLFRLNEKKFYSKEAVY